MKIKSLTNAFFFGFLIMFMVMNFTGCKSSETSESWNQSDMEQIVKNFVKAMNGGDDREAMELLDEKAKYTERFSDGSEYTVNNRKDLQDYIQARIYSETKMKIEQIEFLDNQFVIVQGRASDFVTEIAGMSDGVGFSATYGIKGGKIASIEFIRNRDDEALLNKRTGGMIGVGIELKNGKVMITECSEGMPAEKIGLQEGDIIVAVDGIQTDKMKHGLDEAAYRILGTAGTKVNLTIIRDGKTFDIEVERIESGS